MNAFGSLVLKTIKLLKTIHMKVTNLNQISSEPAPIEWRQIPEIKAQYPKQPNVEKSLQKLNGMNICMWMVSSGGAWKPASDFFHVRK